MTDSYMARLGARLVDNGYPVLKIMPGTESQGSSKAAPGATTGAGPSTARVRPRSTS